MKKIWSIIISFAIFSFILVGCGQTATQPNNEGPLNIVTTFYPMYDFTKNVVGDTADITMLIDGTIEPHDYEPSAKDLAKIQNADVFVYNSEEMETWVSSVLKSINTDKVTVIDASKGITLMAGEQESHDHDDDVDHEEHNGLHVHGTKEHYHTGEKVTLEAHDSDEQPADHYQWFEKKEGEDSFVAIDNANEENYTFTVEKNVNLQVKLLDQEDKVMSESETINITIDDHDNGTEHHEDEDEDTEHHEDEHNHNHSHEYDPHVWLDPVLAIKEVENIRDGLIQASPENKANFEENAKAYIEKLEALNQEYETAFKGATNRTFVTQHAAFSYLARQYNLTQKSISGISPDNEPSAAQLAELETFVKENDVKVIYVEELSSQKIAKTISSATGAELVSLNTLEGLSKEEMESGEDYLSVMEANLNALKIVIN